MLDVNYFSVYRLIQRGKLKACPALRGKLLVPRTELLKLLGTGTEAAGDLRTHAECRLGSGWH